MKNLTKLMYSSGLIIIALAIARWWFIFYDPSQAILGTCIGIILCGFAYVYDWMNTKDMKLQSLDSRLDSLVVELRDRDIVKVKSEIV